ncbi:glycosyltransferase family 4 protein [Paenibacillus camelliae]|uniref:glycosyltransferase family 4 protein n=1 Tax=Paenibacillus camelliae TaxID=512410 RepID=UPI002040EAD2|nr:glycosyltransferase family 4 protein [Paenibacillus camelliae]MCM3633966.1 glycosyltransferase family 4 protein [Paenibacillus camelliae]
MKKMLFISNITKRITNFTLPSIEACKELGYEFHLASNLSEFKDDVQKYNIKLHHLDLERNPFRKQNIIAFKQLLKLIKKEKFDIIHCNTPIGGMLGRICGRLSKTPKIIYTAHGFHFYKGSSLLNSTLFKWAEMAMARYTNILITINTEDYKAASKFKLKDGGEVYHVPGVGINTSAIKNEITKRDTLLNSIKADDDSIVLMSVGELNKNKNNEIIVRALGEIKNQKIHYILCGVGDKKEHLIDLSKNYNIEKNVHFLGYRDDIAKLLKSCDIFVMPSYREGLSRAIMEAMSAGLPCIVSNIRGNVDLIRDGKGGFLCDPNNVQDFKVAIEKLCNNSTLRSDMGNYNLFEVEKYDFENIRKEIKKIYLSLNK